jgi:uncharacterized protein (UPF0333 family)
MAKFIKKYSLEEIEKRTHISPLTLKKLFEYRFDSISEIKFYGFLKILETEFPDEDFSELREKAEGFYKIQKELNKNESQEEKIDPPKVEEQSKKFKLFITLFLLGAVVAVFYYLQSSTKVKEKSIETKSEKNVVKVENSIPVPPIKMEQKKEEEDNKTIVNSSVAEENNSKVEKVEEVVDNNETTTIEEENVTEEIKPFEENMTLVIIPRQRVWFRVTDLNSGKRKNYLQAEPQELNGSKNLYIEFGHGMEVLKYRGKKYDPYTTKKVNFVLINGELNMTNKSPKEFLK